MRPPTWARVPTGVTIFSTPDGWRHSIHAGGFLCGRLDLPADASDEDAKSVATELVVSVALDFHGVALEIDWLAGESPRSWNGIARQMGTQIT